MRAEVDAQRLRARTDGRIPAARGTAEPPAEIDAQRFFASSRGRLTQRP